MFNLFGSDSPLLAASNFVGWIKRVARIHRVCGGYTPSALYPPYTVNTPQLAAGIFIVRRIATLNERRQIRLYGSRNITNFWQSA